MAKDIKTLPPKSTTMAARKKAAGDKIQSPDLTMERKIKGKNLIGGR